MEINKMEKDKYKEFIKVVIKEYIEVFNIKNKEELKIDKKYLSRYIRDSLEVEDLIEDSINKYLREVNIEKVNKEFKEKSIKNIDEKIEENKNKYIMGEIKVSKYIEEYNKLISKRIKIEMR